MANSWEDAHLSSDVAGYGVLTVFEAVWLDSPTARSYQASSSEMFGTVQAVPQTEEGLLWPGMVDAGRQG